MFVCQAMQAYSCLLGMNLDKKFVKDIFRSFIYLYVFENCYLSRKLPLAQILGQNGPAC